MRSRLPHAAVISGLLACFLHAAAPSWAQKPPPPVLPNPQAPVLAMPYPGGAMRGTSAELLLTGTNLAGATALLTAPPLQLSLLDAANSKPENNKELKIHVEVPMDAPPGYYPLRLATTRGMSNVRLFCVDDLPNVEAGNCQKFDDAQAVSVPCVVVGRTINEGASYFKIAVHAGQRLSFDVLGRRLGSPLDPELTIYNATTRRIVAHDNDSPGCQSDPRLALPSRTPATTS